MPLAIVLSALVAAGAPPAAQDPVAALLHPTAATAAPAPLETAKPAASPAAPEAKAGETPAADDSDIPGGAPSDDFGFVAWCAGALAGHMALYPAVKPQLLALARPDEAEANAKLDAEQLAAGEEYLKLYNRALTAAASASGANLEARKLAGEAQGSRIWSAARAADPQTRMWSWIMWELPARCEIAANRLEKSSRLLGAALKGGLEETPAAAPAPPAPAPAADPAPAPPATAQETGLRRPQ